MTKRPSGDNLVHRIDLIIVNQEGKILIERQGKNKDQPIFIGGCVNPQITLEADIVNQAILKGGQLVDVANIRSIPDVFTYDHSNFTGSGSSKMRERLKEFRGSRTEYYGCKTVREQPERLAPNYRNSGKVFHWVDYNTLVQIFQLTIEEMKTKAGLGPTPFESRLSIIQNYHAFLGIDTQATSVLS